MVGVVVGRKIERKEGGLAAHYMLPKGLLLCPIQSSTQADFHLPKIY